MIDVLTLVGDRGDLIGYWEVSRHRDGVLLRAATRQTYATSEDASAGGDALVRRLTRAGRLRHGDPVVRARSERTPSGEIWRAWVEVPLCRAPRRADVQIG